VTPATNESRRQSDNSNSFHEAFLARAANAGEQRAKARALGAFLTLRLVDQFGKVGAPNLGAESLDYQLQAASDFVSQLFPRTVEVNHLTEIVRVAEGVARTESVRILWPPLLAFGYWLEHHLRLDEALDVLDTALRLSDGRTAEEEVATQLQRARVLRKAGRLSEASESYAHAGGLAIALADHRSELRSRIGRAIVLQKTGNLPESERVLREVLADARALGDCDAEAQACHDLAVALALREQFAEAIPFAFRAYELYEHPTHKARALNDTGSLFKELGHYSAAKDALMVTVGGCPSTEVVLRAKLELLDVSALIGDRVSFERWRRELRADRSLMPPDIQVDLATKVGVGLAGFGRTADAEAELKRAIVVAEEHGLGEGLFRAERGLQEVREGRARRVDAAALPLASQPSPDVQRTIDSLRTLCASLETATAL
jgi:tetratricopeptide (TPR) repeat protein